MTRAKDSISILLIKIGGCVDADTCTNPIVGILSTFAYSTSIRAET